MPGDAVGLKLLMRQRQQHRRGVRDEAPAPALCHAHVVPDYVDDDGGVDGADDDDALVPGAQRMFVVAVAWVHVEDFGAFGEGRRVEATRALMKEAKTMGTKAMEAPVEVEATERLPESLQEVIKVFSVNSKRHQENCGRCPFGWECDCRCRLSDWQS